MCEAFVAEIQLLSRQAEMKCKLWINGALLTVIPVYTTSIFVVCLLCGS